tara:strand:+ start:219 stop:1058 length:840 start_codon:yes stop_codon:yes gene_type:complete
MRYIVLILLISKLAFSQTAILDTNSILIGQQTNLTITSELNKTDFWPILDSIIPNEIEIINKSNIDTADNLLSQQFIITSWDSGSYYISPVKFSKLSQTSGILLNVFTVEINTDETLKDIKGPIDEPIGWNDIWPWLSAFIFLLVLIYLVKKYLLKEKKKDLVIKEEVEISADITALEQLVKLENSKIWQKGNVKEYYSRLSEIIRRYTEDRFNFNALEITTEEIINELKDHIDDQQLYNLKLLLQRADLAKFAKSKPIDTENSESMSMSKQFISLTKE